MTNKNYIKTPLYTCFQCRSIHQTLQDLLFVEEKSSKGFCSEACIEDFYRPVLKYYERLEAKLREELNLVDETVLFGISDEEVMKKLIESPDEVWRLTNELGEEVFSYIKYFNKAYFIVLCTSFKNEPSYIFSTLKTTDERMLNEYRIGEVVSQERKHLQDLEEIIEAKKSEVLARILEVNSDVDITMDRYTDYEHFFEDTMHEADEIYELKDKHGDMMVTYIKSFKDHGEGIFYIVVCIKSDSPSLKYIEQEIPGLNAEEDRKKELMTIFPIMAFPTRSGEVYKEFKQGKLLSGHLNN